MYQEKLISAEDAAGLVESGMTIHLGGSANLAAVIDTHLAKRSNELRDVTVRTYLDTTVYEMCTRDPEGKSFRWSSGFLLPFSREFSKQRGVGVHTPGTWHMAPHLIRTGLELDIFYLVATPMDETGHFNFGLSVTETMALIEAAQKTVVIIRDDMPHINGGYEEAIHISKIDHIVEEDRGRETFCLPAVEASNQDAMIAENILETGLIQDGSTLQIGIGGLPNAVLTGIRDAGLKHLGLHTEMMTEKMLDLIESGVVDNSQKLQDRFKTVFAFCLGSRKLYDHLDRNPLYASYPVDYTNHPMVIASQPKMFSLNSIAQIDLTGQVASEQIGTERPYVISGSGGQLDFVMGTAFSKDKKGVSILAFYSEYNGKSRVLPFLTQGTNVTVPRTLVDYVASEWGVARLRGLAIDERAKALIAIAHPDHREALAREAQDKGITCYRPLEKFKIPKGVVYLRP